MTRYLLTRRRVYAAMLVAFLGAVISGCDGDGPLDPGEQLQVEAAGWIERNAVIQILALRGGVPLPAAEWSLSVVPAEAAEVDDEEGTIRPTAAGPLTVIVSAAGDEAEIVLDVEAPPIIAFDRLHEGNRDIVSVALDGGDLVRLTTHAAEDREPTSSGGWIVFTSFRDGPGSLYRMPAAGGVVQRLTATGARDAEAALASAGDRLAFIRTAGGNPRLFLSAADATGATAVTPLTAGVVEARPAWSPTADRVVFMSTRNGDADLWILPVGGAASFLSGSSSADVEPTWSPDGATIVFVSNRDGDSELYRLNVSTGEVARLTNRPGTDGQPAFLPDGRLVYTAWVNNVPELRWLDPSAPANSFTIPTGPGTPERPQPVR